MRYKILEGVTWADYAYEIYGKDLEELFVNAAFALTESMVDSTTLNTSQKKTIKLREQDIEKLLYNFLEEIIFYKDSESLLFKDFKVNIKRDIEGYDLNAELFGEKINLNKHKLRTDVKALTYHYYKLEKLNGNYKATIVLDV